MNCIFLIYHNESYTIDNINMNIVDIMIIPANKNYKIIINMNIVIVSGYRRYRRYINILIYYYNLLCITIINNIFNIAI